MTGCPRCGGDYWTLTEVGTVHHEHFNDHGTLHHSWSDSQEYTGRIHFRCLDCGKQRTGNLYGQGRACPLWLRQLHEGMRGKE